MINEKMYNLGSARSEIRELFEYGKKRKAEIGEENVYDFSLGNPSVPCPVAVGEAMSELLRTHDPIDLHGYTSAQGDAATRKAIADSISNTHSFHVSADDLYLTVGAAAALTSTLCAIATEGEEVILLAPYFPEYKVFVERAGATIRTVKCDPTTFAPDPKAIADVINEKTAAIIINSPNNPTGAVYSEESIKAIAHILKSRSEELGKSIYLIADEPYRELVYDSATVPFIPKFYNNTIVCYSYSKSLSLPGERIGYVLVSPMANEHTKVYAAVCGAGRSLGYVCAPSFLQKVLPYCIGTTSDISIYAQNRQLLLTKLTEYGFETVKPEGAFYLFLKSPVGDGKAFSELAKKHEILLVPSDSFGYPGYVRISYCVNTERIESALGAFRKLAQELGLIGESNGK